MRMSRGESAELFGKKFDEEQPSIYLVGRGKRAYLWVGGAGGPCYATLDRPADLRRLAVRILKALGEP